VTSMWGRSPAPPSSCVSANPLSPRRLRNSRADPARGCCCVRRMALRRPKQVVTSMNGPNGPSRKPTARNLRHAAPPRPCRAACVSAVPLTFTRLHVLPALSIFLAEHPSIDVGVVLEDHDLDLIAAGLDVALLIGRLRAARWRRKLGLPARNLGNHGYRRRPSSGQRRGGYPRGGARRPWLCHRL
jgi:hypothetical protein